MAARAHRGDAATQARRRGSRPRLGPTSARPVHRHPPPCRAAGTGPPQCGPVVGHADGGAERRRSLTVEQAKRLMDASKGDRLHAMVVVGLMLGLRPGELRGLTWADIDLRSGTLRVSGVEKGGRRVDDVKVSHERAKRTLVMPAP